MPTRGKPCYAQRINSSDFPVCVKRCDRIIPMGNRKGVAPILLIIAVAAGILAFGGGWYITSLVSPYPPAPAPSAPIAQTPITPTPDASPAPAQNPTSTPAAPSASTTPSSSVPQAATTTPKATTTQATAPPPPATGCANSTCFANDFTACKATTFTDSAAEFGTAKYEILGSSQGGCGVKLTYVQSSDSSWVDQPMTCSLDNSQGFQADLQKEFENIIQSKMTTCSGPLVAKIQGL